MAKANPKTPCADLIEEYRIKWPEMAVITGPDAGSVECFDVAKGEFRCVGVIRAVTIRNGRVIEHREIVENHPLTGVNDLVDDVSLARRIRVAIFGLAKKVGLYVE